jgi:glycosyltransferase involved in cell wall biosynthesis
MEPLIAAAERLGDTNVVFQFIGDGPKKLKLQELVVGYGVGNVQFLPYQAMKDLPEMLSAADLAVVCLESAFTGLVVPSKAYGIMASATPIMGLVDRYSEIGRMITETGCGVLVAPDADRIAAAIGELMADAERRRAMGDAGRRVFLEKYTLDRASRAYDAALWAMLKRRGDSPNGPR